MDRTKFYTLIDTVMIYEDIRRDKREKRNFVWRLKRIQRQCEFCRRKYSLDQGIIHQKRDGKWLKWCNNCKIDITNKM